MHSEAFGSLYHGQGNGFMRAKNRTQCFSTRCSLYQHIAYFLDDYRTSSRLRVSGAHTRYTKSILASFGASASSRRVFPTTYIHCLPPLQKSFNPYILCCKFVANTSKPHILSQTCLLSHYRPFQTRSSTSYASTLHPTGPQSTMMNTANVRHSTAPSSVFP
jgi:hypothetical protein